MNEPPTARRKLPPHGPRTHRPARSADAEYCLRVAIEEWLLGRAERGNPASALDAWCAGNAVRPLVHGASYFERLVQEVEALAAGRPPDVHRLAG